MSRTRREYHSTGAKVMRKIKGRGWIAVATTALALGGINTNNNFSGITTSNSGSADIS